MNGHAIAAKRLQSDKLNAEVEAFLSGKKPKQTAKPSGCTRKKLLAYLEETGMTQRDFASLSGLKISETRNVMLVGKKVPKHVAERIESFINEKI